MENADGKTIVCVDIRETAIDPLTGGVLPTKIELSWLAEQIKITLRMHYDADACGPIKQVRTAPMFQSPPFPPQKARPAAASFGPVVERTISIAAGATTKKCLNLQTGQLLALQIDLTRDPSALEDWFARNGVDAVATGGETIPGTDKLHHVKWGLTSQRMKAVHVGKELWDKAVPDDLAVIDPFYNPRLLEGCDDEPATFLILTRNGTRGVLQILAANDQRAAVRIRYKLRQSE